MLRNLAKPLVVHRLIGKAVDLILVFFLANTPQFHSAFYPAGPLADPAAAARPKKFILDMFPYPSGAGLHMGHPLGFTATDMYARYSRATGHNVLYTMGFDAFGLPAEQYAVQTGTHPRITTEANVANMRRQLRRLGLSHDLRRSIDTTDPDYYRWTQWIFLVLFDTWFDPVAQRGRPIAELPIPADVAARGPEAVAAYLLRRLPRRWPELMAALEKLDQASLSAGRALSVPFVREVLELPD